jgi:hypothetical protein
MSTMDLLKIILTYLHLIACCLAIGPILINDAGILIWLWGGHVEKRANKLRHLKQIVCWMLAVLWITGLLLIAHQAAHDGWGTTLSNPKLQAKIFVVALLTLNGAFLHYRVLPMMDKARSLLRLDAANRTRAIVAGAVSGVSWMYAAFLGTARPLSFKAPLVDLLIPYPFLIMLASAGIWVFTTYVLFRIDEPLDSLFLKSDSLFMNSLIGPSEAADVRR